MIEGNTEDRTNDLTKKTVSIVEDSDKNKSERWRNSETWLMVLALSLCFLGFPLAALGHLEYCVVVEAKDICGLNFFQRFLKLPPNEMGDTLAGLFGSLAFLAAALAIILQSFELAAQREELKLTRIEFKKMAKAQKGQASTLQKQQFERTFFEMISKYREIVASVSWKQPMGAVDGQAAFRNFKSDFLSKYSKEQGGDELEKTSASYLAFWNGQREILYPYFKFMTRFLDFLNRSDGAEKFHAEVLEAQVSDAEMALLYYHICLLGTDETKASVAKFEFFEGMKPNDFAHRSHLTLAPEGSFGSNESLTDA